MRWGKWWIGKKKKESFPFIFPLNPNSFLIGQPVGHRLPVTSSRLLYVSWPRMFVKKYGRHQSWGTSVIFFDETAGQAGTIRSSKQWSTVYASLSSCPPDGKGKGKGNLRSEKSIQLSKFLLSYPMPLDFFNMNIFVIRSRTFPWIRLSKRVCLLVYKKNKINLYCDTILKYLDI